MGWNLLRGRSPFEAAGFRIAEVSVSSEIKTLQGEVPKALRLPTSVADILRKRRMLKTELLKQANLVPTRIAILGGSTTGEVRSMMELFLLAQGIQPTFYESGYNRYCEDIRFENA